MSYWVIGSLSRWGRVGHARRALINGQDRKGATTMTGGNVGDRFEEWLRQRAQQREILGLAYAVTDAATVLCTGGFGYADVAREHAMSARTLLPLASITKCFTSLAIMQQCEAGRLDLHAPVSAVLPWFHVPSPYAPITLHHLLTHTAGIVSGTEGTPGLRYEVTRLRETAASCPPGTYLHYSNVGYKTLGCVLEEVMDQSYSTIIGAQILAPLGMSATEAAITQEILQRLSMGYQYAYDDRPPSPSMPLVPAPRVEYGGADGGMASTARDMASFVQMLLNRGQGPHSRILSAQSIDQMTRAQAHVQEGMSYGYGFLIHEVDGHRWIGHPGGHAGFTSGLLADVEAGLGLVVLISGPANAYALAYHALHFLRPVLDGTSTPPAAPPPPAGSEDAAEFAGTYTSEHATFTIVAEGQQVVLRQGNERSVLERRGPDSFYVDHPTFALYLLRIQRVDGHAVEAFHGPDWYTTGSYEGPRHVDHPRAWVTYGGHYRSYSPWVPSLRIVLRKGQLVYVAATGEEEPLVPLDDGSFRVGQDERSPERMLFDTVVRGHAQRVVFSTGAFYRVETP